MNKIKLYYIYSSNVVRTYGLIFRICNTSTMSYASRILVVRTEEVGVRSYARTPIFWALIIHQCILNWNSSFSSCQNFLNNVQNYPVTIITWPEINTKRCFIRFFSLTILQYNKKSVLWLYKYKYKYKWNSDDRTTNWSFSVRSS